MQQTLNFHPVFETKFLDQNCMNLTDCISEVKASSEFPSNNLITATKMPASKNFGIRRILTGLLLVVIGALMWTVVTHVAGLNTDQVGADLSPDAPQEIYVVQSGDTLWSIAMRLDTDGDPRDTVDKLADLNGGSDLYIGQRLVVGN
jgi:hypothetical protein